MRQLTMLAALCAVPCAFGAFERTVPATDGVGDVVALTNALTELNALADGDTTNARIYLQPGLYDLAGIRMTADSHLFVEHARNFVFAGLGDEPGDTILRGGGETDACRVLSVVGGGNYWSNTYSNFTVTGGYVAGQGGGIRSSSLDTRYVRLVVSNNVSTTTDRYHGGGGVNGGVAERCLFADNRSALAGGAFDPGTASKTRPGESAPYLYAYATDCVFSNNAVTAYNPSFPTQYAGGAVTGGTYVRCRFYGNRSARHGGAIGRSEACPSSVAIDCEFVGNVATNNGGAVYGATALTNCTFAGNASSGADGFGGAVDAVSDSVPAKAVNCVFTGNTAANGAVGRNVDFTDCVITNNAGCCALYNANMTRCYVAGNVTVGSNANPLDFAATGNARTNVNCVFSGNRQVGYGSLSSAKVIVNCAYLDNVYGNGNYSPLFAQSALVYNTVFSGNKINTGTPCDIRTSGLGWSEAYPTLVNCIFSTTNGDAAGNGNYTACRQVAADALRYTKTDAERPLMPSRRSAMFNGGFEADWLLALVGDRDCYGRARRLFDKIDIGPAECDEKVLGMLLIVR